MRTLFYAIYFRGSLPVIPRTTLINDSAKKTARYINITRRAEFFNPTMDKLPNAIELSLYDPDSVIFHIKDSKFTANWNGLHEDIFSNSSSWKHPLYSPYSNAFNPKFIDVASLLVILVIALFGLYQLVNLFLIKKKSTTKKLSIILIIKYLLISIALASFAVLYVLTGRISLLINAIVAVFIISPIHLIEPYSAAAGHASVLTYWAVNLFTFSITLTQDLFSKHKVYYSSELALPLEAFVWVSAGAVLILEGAYYQPLFEVGPKELHYNIFSLLSYTWIRVLMKKVYASDNISIKDLPLTANDLYVDETFGTLNVLWNNSVKAAKASKGSIFRHVPLVNRIKYFKKPASPSLFGAIASSVKKYLIITTVFEIFDVLLSFSQPFLLRSLLLFINEFNSNKGLETQPPIIKGFIISFTMFTVTVTQSVLFNQSLYISLKALYAVDSSLTYLIYSKALKLTPNAKKNKTTGDIINHITTDVMTIKWFYQGFSEFISAPMRLIVCLWSLYKLLGIATLGGIAAAGLLIPLVSYVTAAVYTLYNEMMKNKDVRTSFVNEVLLSVKSIKLYSWEGPMLKRLTDLRAKELASNKSVGVYNALSTFLWACIPFFISCATYSAFAYLYDIPLTPEIVFPALTLFNLLSDPVLTLPRLLTNFIEALTSFHRVDSYLVLDEIDDFQGGVFTRHETAVTDGDAVTVKNASFLWASKPLIESFTDTPVDEEATPEVPANPVALHDINFSAEAGKLTCVVGKVGSGKTTLLRCILSELPCSNTTFSDDSTAPRASVEIKGNVAYCPQSPWILNASVKENILFGHALDVEFYKKTVQACALVSDFTSLPDGDKTVVGEKGISLSGGQKARISLARAVYARADIYLFDDILSAVDSHVGKHIIKNVLSDTGIIGNRTKILATNSVSVLSKANQIYLLKASSISESGDFETVMAAKGDLATLIEEFGKGHEDEESDSDEELDVVIAQSNEDTEEAIADFVGVGVEAQKIQAQAMRRASVVSFNHIYADDEEAELDDDGKPKARKTGLVEEYVATGGVKFEVIMEYIRACNYKYVLFYLVLIFTTSLLGIAEKGLLTRWSEINYETGRTESPVFFLSIYAALGMLNGLFVFLSAYVIWSYCILLGSTYFHAEMARGILRSPMSFFETTPIGRILNRFTDDIATIDMQLPWMFIYLLEMVLSGLVTLVVIVYSLPSMFLIIVALMFLYNYYRLQYVPSSRQLKRLQKIAKSPVLATIQESINGVDTIKAYGQTERFTHKSKTFINDVVLVQMVAQACNRWLSVRLQTISGLILFGLSSLATYSLITTSPIGAGLFGFLMTYALNITNILNGVVRAWAEVETQSVSIERISEYCNVTPEAEMIVEDNRPPTNWPSNGEIVFKDYSTKYRENLDPVLKNINIAVQSKEKIGIVGRTGAGKSSLTLALFRIIEPTTGYIDIDNVDTSKIGLYDLRHNLTIIPQESHIVKGTVRQNLDPFDDYSDEQLWKVLGLAHLKEHIELMRTDPTESEKEDSKDPDSLKAVFGLDAKLDESGSNLSQGQKQLLSLARALLNESSKILVLDEATASVDVQTDKIIQETIRSEFKDKTILTIAHRLETVMDSDRVLVLDKGEVREFDTPAVLLKDELSIFYSLCKEGGYLKN